MCPDDLIGTLEGPVHRSPSPVVAGEGRVGHSRSWSIARSSMRRRIAARLGSLGDLGQLDDVEVGIPNEHRDLTAERDGSFPDLDARLVEGADGVADRGDTERQVVEPRVLLL